MKWGAFILLDCLGFKGIWGRFDPKLVQQRFSEIQKYTEAYILEAAQRNAGYSYGPIETRIALISDTIAVSIQYSNDSELSKKGQDILVGIAGQAASEIIRLFYEGKPLLLLRGCITCGLHTMDGTLIIGPAVDEAAENMDDADGPFVWFQPDANAVYSRLMARTFAYSKIMAETAIKFDSEPFTAIAKKYGLEIPKDVNINKYLAAFFEVGFDLQGMFAFNYNVPKKDGTTQRRLIVNPCAHTQYIGKEKELLDNWLTTMPGTAANLVTKRQNTIALLANLSDHLLQSSNEWTESISKLEESGVLKDMLLNDESA